MARKCPICKKAVPERGTDLPFCSARCKDVDLGRWLTGAYIISRPLDPDEASESLIREDGDSGGDDAARH